MKTYESRRRSSTRSRSVAPVAVEATAESSSAPSDSASSDRRQLVLRKRFTATEATPATAGSGALYSTTKVWVNLHSVVATTCSSWPDGHRTVTISTGRQTIGTHRRSRLRDFRSPVPSRRQFSNFCQSRGRVPRTVDVQTTRTASSV